MNDEYFMKMAIQLAEKGRGFTSPNPMVGAVIVKEGRVVGSGFHQAAGKAHAEVNAIKDAGSLARGSSLYVTLEPCNHTGRMPPCTEAILEAGIERVIMAMQDPNPDVKGGGMEYLNSHNIPVISGVCEEAATKLNEVYTKFVTTRRPFVTLKCAATLDGRIATRTGDSKWVSGEASRKFVHELRHAADAIMVGIGTINQDNPSLTTRLDNGTGVDPTRIILDSNLSISENAKVLRLDSDFDTILVTGSSIPLDKKTRLEKENIRILPSALKEGLIDLDRLMIELGSMGITSILVEGGSRVISSALSAGIVDKVVFFYAPKILGGDDGMPMCSGPGPALMKESISVKKINVQRFGDDVMIEGYIP